jgi:hypothetical protein
MQNQQTKKNYLWKDNIYIAEREIKGLGYEVFLIQIKQQVGEKIALCTHGNADCLWKKMSIKHNKYVVSQKFDDINFRKHFGKIRVFFFNKMYLFPRQDICIYVGYYFYKKTVVGLIVLICIWALSWNSCVDGREDKSFGFERTWWVWRHQRGNQNA